MNTSSEFSATRQMVIVGDRIVAVFDSGYPTHDGKVPMTTYRFVSMRLSNGKVENPKDLQGRWGAMPSIFANSEGRVVLSDAAGLQLLNPDLTPAGTVNVLDHGRANTISPDGKVIAHETNPGTEFVDANTLALTGLTFKQSVPGSISPTSVITGNRHGPSSTPTTRNLSPSRTHPASASSTAANVATVQTSSANLESS